MSARPPAVLDPIAREGRRLAGDVPGVLIEARRVAAAAPGVHGRRRAGQGEDFWQFRDHRREDGARRVDWRRSARGDRLYVREREMEAAQDLGVWIDGEPGFAWSSAPEKHPSKRRRALVLAVAAGIIVARAGERVGALGGQARGGPNAGERLAEALASRGVDEPSLPSNRGAVLLVSDGYAPLDLWRGRLRRIAQTSGPRALLLVQDPAEEDFPFEGRVRFEAEGGGDPVVLGRAQDARSEYQAKLSAHMSGLREAAAAHDVAVVRHRTDAAPPLALTQVLAALGERRR